MIVSHLLVSIISTNGSAITIIQSIRGKTENADNSINFLIADIIADLSS